MEFSSFFDGLDPLVQFILTLLAAFLAGWVVAHLLFALLAWNARRTGSEVQKLLVDCLRPAVVWFLPLLFVTIAAGTIELESWPALWIAKGAEIFLYITGAWVMIRFVDVVASAVARQYDITETDNLDERKILTQLQYIKRVIVVVLVIVTLAFILLQFESVRELGTGLLTSAGVAGIIIGFAAQKSIANLLAGFQIAFTQPIRLDDVVIVDGEFGRVEEITLTYVVVRLWDQRRQVVPLNYFLDNVFQNWTRTDSELLGTVFLYTDYTLPVQAIRDELDKVLDTNENWDGRVKAVQVTDAKADHMEVRILVSARNAGSAFDLRCAVREHMIAYIQEHYPASLPRTRISMETIPEEESSNRGAKARAADRLPQETSPGPEEGKEELVEANKNDGR